MMGLRLHAEKDIPFRVKWFNNPTVKRFVDDASTKKATIKSEREWFKRYRKNPTKKFFTIIESGKPIGIVGLTKIDKANRNAEVFIMIGEDSARGKGYGTQAVRQLIDFGFGKLKLHRIFLYVYADNKAAIGCYKAAGFRKEGILRDRALFGKRYRDEVIMSILNK